MHPQARHALAVLAAALAALAPGVTAAAAPTGDDAIPPLTRHNDPAAATVATATGDPHRRVLTLGRDRAEPVRVVVYLDTAARPYIGTGPHAII